MTVWFLGLYINGIVCADMGINSLTQNDDFGYRMCIRVMDGAKSSPVAKRPLMVVPIELFLISTSASRLVFERP